MTTLVIGFGNPLRGDDGVGLTIAQTLADNPPPDCQVIVRHQLTPELADAIANATLVVFVDAAADAAPGVVVIRQIRESAKSPTGLGHASDPPGLLGLARRLYGRAPETFLVGVGAGSFALGEGLSDMVTAALPEAIAAVRKLVSQKAGGEYPSTGNSVS